MKIREICLFKHLIKLLASALLAVGCLPASAGYLYSLDVKNTDVGDFNLLVPSLITTTTTFQLADFASINAPGSTAVQFEDPLGASPTIWFTPIGYFWISPFSGPGAYCSGFGGCNQSAAILTISKVSDVPEPESIALVGLGLIGLLFSRRKKV